jgi:acetyl esterase/lipase
MPVRAWLLLQHLDLWRTWGEDDASLFHGQVDMERVALMGHSRGGEAAAAAW